MDVDVGVSVCVCGGGERGGEGLMHRVLTTVMPVRVSDAFLARMIFCYVHCPALHGSSNMHWSIGGWH